MLQHADISSEVTSDQTGLGREERLAMDPRHADWEININCLHLATCGGLSGLERELP